MLGLLFSLYVCVSLSVCVSLRLSVCLFVCLSLCLSVWLSVCLSLCLSLSLYLSVCLSVSLPLSLCLSVCLLNVCVCLSVCLFICLSVCLSLVCLFDHDYGSFPIVLWKPQQQTRHPSQKQDVYICMECYNGLAFSFPPQSKPKQTEMVSVREGLQASHSGLIGEDGGRHLNGTVRVSRAVKRALRFPLNCHFKQTAWHIVPSPLCTELQQTNSKGCRGRRN